MSRVELQKKLEDTILLMQETGAPARGQEIREAIHRAAVSGDDGLKGLAAAAAYFMVEPQFTVIARRHQDMYGRPEVADFLAELKIFILENIEKYDPANSPYTWLEYRYMPIFQETKNAEYGIKRTIHETRVDSLVSRAKAELFKQTGNASPTEIEVYDYLVSTMGKGKASMDAVRKAMQGVSVYTSHELLTAVPDASKSPEGSLLEKAKSEEFLSALRKLSKRNRAVILAEMAFNDEHGELPSTEVLAGELKGLFPDASVEEIRRYIFSAHNELRRRYRKKEAMDSPVNRMGGSGQEVQMEEEERMLIEAIEEDASILDFI